LRSSGDDCRMPAEGGVPSSESAHRERLQKHNNHAGHGSSYYDPEYARMEAWLDEHPDFVQDYFLRYMTECCDVERWRISMRPRCHPQIRHDPRRVPFKEQVDKLNVNSSELLRFFRFRITGNGLRKNNANLWSDKVDKLSLGEKTEGGGGLIVIFWTSRGVIIWQVIFSFVCKFTRGSRNRNEKFRVY
jgi:hypothetical protein